MDRLRNLADQGSTVVSRTGRKLPVLIWVVVCFASTSLSVVGTRSPAVAASVSAAPNGPVTLTFEDGGESLVGTIYGTHDTNPEPNHGQALHRDGYVLDVVPNSNSPTTLLHFHEVDSRVYPFIPVRGGTGPGVLFRDPMSSGVDPVVITRANPAETFLLNGLVVGISSNHGQWGTTSVRMTGYLNGQTQPVGSVDFAPPQDSYKSFDEAALGSLAGKSVNPDHSPGLVN